jgi:hypothetical protein
MLPHLLNLLIDEIEIVRSDVGVMVAETVGGPSILTLGLQVSIFFVID